MVQLDLIMKKVSTLGGIIEHERERDEPDTSIISTADTSTDGLGTEREQVLTNCKSKLTHFAL